MKHVAVVGAGLSGLRASLELLRSPQLHVTLFEKSPSVGGRVATRRFGKVHVNHGAESFDGSMRLHLDDPLAPEFTPHFSFSGHATALPKALRDRLAAQAPRFTAHFNRRVTQVTSGGALTTAEDGQRDFDHVLLTCPIPQARELLGMPVLPGAVYSKKILLIGAPDSIPVRLAMPGPWSEEHFEKSDEEIRALAGDRKGLDVKKWRYAEVKQGIPLFFFSHSDHLTFAGDAFDPLRAHTTGSAWLSGMKAGEFIAQVLESPNSDSFP